MHSDVWRNIRALRAVPTGQASTDVERWARFRAALRQSEELADAAAAAGYASNSLPLFYSVEQAGLAVASAWLTDDAKLEKMTSHGIGFKLDRDALNILHGTVGGKNGTFAAVCAAVGSPDLTGRAELGALWMANPDLCEVAIPVRYGQWRKPIQKVFGSRRPVDEMTSVPLDPNIQMTTTGGHVWLDASIPGVTVADIARETAHYPSLADATAMVQVFEGGVKGDIVARSGADAHGITFVPVGKPAPSQVTLTDYWRLEDSLFSVVENYPDTPTTEPHVYKVGYALPAVGGGPAPAPLMLWWALLLGLSSLVRYHPEQWTNAVDVDSSELAVSLQRVLDIAMDRVPQRLYQALIGKANLSSQ